MQTPDNEREVLVQLEYGGVTMGQYRGGAWMVSGEPAKVLAWCEPPARIEQGAALVPITAHIANMVMRAVSFCASDEYGIEPSECGELRDIFGSLDKPA